MNFKKYLENTTQINFIKNSKHQNTYIILCKYYSQKSKIYHINNI